MNLEDAWSATVTRDEALQEVNNHGCDAGEILKDVGDRDEYLGGDVLSWLGW